MATTGHQLQQAYQSIVQGERQHAANLLTVLLAQDHDNADAWWLLAQAATEPDTVRYALERLLALRPDDQRAHHMLATMGVRQQLSDARRASQELRNPAIPQPPLPELPPPALPLERFVEPRLHASGNASMSPRHTQPRRRYGGLYPERHTRSGRLYLYMLGFTLLFGLVGCLLLTYAVVGGLRLVEEAVHGFLPVLPELPFVTDSISPPDWPNIGNTTTIGTVAYHQWRSGLLSSPSDQHGYTFSGAANDFILIDVTARDGVLDPALALYGPDGALVEANADVSPDNRNARLALRLPVAGTYTILISAPNAPGEYQLTLRDS